MSLVFFIAAAICLIFGTPYLWWAVLWLTLAFLCSELEG